MILFQTSKVVEDNRNGVPIEFNKKSQEQIEAARNLGVLLAKIAIGYLPSGADAKTINEAASAFKNELLAQSGNGLVFLMPNQTPSFPPGSFKIVDKDGNEVKASSIGNLESFLKNGQSGEVGTYKRSAELSSIGLEKFLGYAYPDAYVQTYLQDIAPNFEGNSANFVINKGLQLQGVALDALGIILLDNINSDHPSSIAKKILEEKPQEGYVLTIADAKELMLRIPTFMDLWQMQANDLVHPINTQK